jgi:hypothetical protein
VGEVALVEIHQAAREVRGEFHGPSHTLLGGYTHDTSLSRELIPLTSVTKGCVNVVDTTVRSGPRALVNRPKA